MMRSMFAAVSGLRNHQTMMDVLSSNISNVNTFGYKSQRASFKDSLYQNLSGAGAPVPAEPRRHQPPPGGPGHVAQLDRHAHDPGQRPVAPASSPT